MDDVEIPAPPSADLATDEARPVPAGGGRDSDPTLIGILSRSLEAQTKAVTDGLHEVRAEIRSMRWWIVGLIGLAMILVVGIVGVSVVVELPSVGGITTTAPAGP